MRKSICLLLSFFFLLTNLCGCGNMGDSTASTPKSFQSSESELSSTPEDQSVFPYIPEIFDPWEEYPTLYYFDGEFDTSKNNQVLGNASFYLDGTLFDSVETKYHNSLIFDSKEGSQVGPMRISVLCQDISELSFLVRNKDGSWEEVYTLNVALDNFLSYTQDEVFSYFSENVRGHYIPAAIFTVDNAVGFIFYIYDSDNVYSVQFLCYDPAQTAVMKDVFNSMIFL